MDEKRTEHVVVVDDRDTELGVADKFDAHKGQGLLHRAVSVCLFDEGGRVFLQRRALTKYHFAGRWSNSCCTHPRPGESPRDAVVRRLTEELGVTARSLEAAGRFTYRASDPRSGFVEHELDHVFTGVMVNDPVPDTAEVMDWRLVDAVAAESTNWRAPTYTPWLEGVLRVAGVVGSARAAEISS